MTLYALVFIYLIPIILLDNTAANLGIEKFNISCKNKFLSLLNKGVTFILCLILINHIWINNINYTAIYYTTKQTESYWNNFVSDIRNIDGYRTDMKVALIGDIIQDPSYRNIWSPLREKYESYSSNMLNDYSRKKFILTYTGYQLSIVEDEMLLSKLKVNPIILNMPTYPNDGAIKIIDNIIVVKLEN